MRHLVVLGLAGVLVSAAVACGDDETVTTGAGGSGAQAGGGQGPGPASGPGGGGSGGGDSCGNGVVDGDDDCDGSDLAGASCESLGFGPGTLACSATCGFDTSQCAAPPNCGDGNIDRGEQCDGSELAGASCKGEGFDGGDIACDARCQLDTSGCCTSVCDENDTQCSGGTVETCELDATNNCLSWVVTDDCAASSLACDSVTTTCLPAGDHCGTAVDLTTAVLPYELLGTFNEDPAVSGSCYSGNATNAVWFEYTAPATGTYVITANNASTTGAYSRIVVFDGASCDPLSAELACSLAAAKSVAVDIDMTVGETYRILFHTDGNSFTMVDPQIDITPLPPGATCETAVDVTAATFPVTLSGLFPVDPAVVGSCDTTPNNVVWFSYTAASDDLHVFSAENFSTSDAYSRLAIFESASCTPLGTQIACQTATSKTVSASFVPTIGMTYLIAFYTDGESYTMVDPQLDLQTIPPTWTCNPSWWNDGNCDCGCGEIDPDCGANPTVASCDSCTVCATTDCSVSVDPADITQCLNLAGPGNTCADPLPLVSGSYSWQYTTNNFVTGSPSCTGFTANGVDRVHTVTLAAGETLTVTLTPTAGDVSIYLLTNCTDSAGSCVAGSDNTSTGPETLTYTSASGGTYYFIADRFTSGSTSAGYTLAVTIL